MWCIGVCQCCGVVCCVVLCSVVYKSGRPNSFSKPCQIRKFSIQELELDRTVPTAYICYSCPISTVPTNKPLLGEKKTCVMFDVFHVHISKTKADLFAYILLD